MSQRGLCEALLAVHEAHSSFHFLHVSAERAYWLFGPIVMQQRYASADALILLKIDVLFQETGKTRNVSTSVAKMGNSCDGDTRHAIPGHMCVMTRHAESIFEFDDFGKSWNFQVVAYFHLYEKFMLIYFSII